MNVKNRTLFIADNLDILRGINSECIDLIYLDPPFNSKKQYKAPIGSPAEGATFKDIWTDEDIKYEWHGQIAEEHQELYQIIQAAAAVYDPSMKIYLTAMAVRLFEMKRLLKPTGSIYLHCDPTANHYLKLVMDSIFGKKHFRNEIVWCYTGPSNTKRWFPRKHDIILFYAKSDASFFYRDAVRVPYSESFILRRRYSEGESGITAGYSEGREDGEVTASFGSGKIIEDFWTDIPAGGHISKQERTGWPTQKPLALLERIIKASSNAGDVVLDPFCGCATACVAAEQLGRHWIGIDISPSAEVITKIRLDDASEQGKLMGPSLTEVLVQTQAPVRTDITEKATQRHLPKAHVHKHELYGKQEGKCAGCHYFLPFRNMTIDHIVPQSKGGTDAKANLQLLCNACNSTKSTRTQSEFIEILREQGIRTG